MFGLKKEPQEPFQFDLEADIKKDPAEAKKILKHVDERIQALKGLLRQGAETDDFDEYGVMLHAYNALKRVFNRISEKK